MTSIIVTDVGGETMTITDIAPYIAKRDEVVARLERLYADYEHQPETALIPHEATICDLVNAYHRYAGWIEQFAIEETALVNIRAGRALLRQIRGDKQ